MSDSAVEVHHPNWILLLGGRAIPIEKLKIQELYFSSNPKFQEPYDSILMTMLNMLELMKIFAAIQTKHGNLPGQDGSLLH